MNIIILGAGQVGSTVATELSREESNEFTVIDINQQILSDLQDRLDLRTICGNGSYPGLLEDAGADDADMIVALTNSDEINMIACQVASSIFHTPTKVARIRSPGIPAAPRPVRREFDSGGLHHQPGIAGNRVYLPPDRTSERVAGA